MTTFTFIEHRALALLLLALGVGGGAGCGRAEADAPSAGALEVAITVSDLERSRAFFVETLGASVLETFALEGPDFERLTGLPRARASAVRLSLGDERVVLRQFLAPGGRPYRDGAQSRDLDFQHLAIVVRDIDGAHAEVARARTRAVSQSGPERIPAGNVAAAGIRAFYFRDADGHPLELIWYPKGKGQPRWQRAQTALVRGIDHTAIVVDDSARSVAFYELLGLRVAGRSYNHGLEQERLSGVPGARVRITGLHGAGGIGVELLEYEAPGSGTPARPDERASDLTRYETTIAVADLDATLARLRAAGAPLVSSAVGACGRSCAGVTRAAVVRDPDGHAVRVVEAR